MEREREPDEEAVRMRRRAVLHRPPQERPIFQELVPPIQEYVLLEYQKEMAEDIEEKKRISAILQAKGVEVFRRGGKYERMREDITRYGEVVYDELSRIH